MRAFLPLAVALCLVPFAPDSRADEENPAPVKPEAPAAAPGPLLLREAVSRGLVAASGVNPGSYRSVTLRLESRSKEPLSLDLAGSHLRNRTGTKCQRLGLGPAPSFVARSDGHGRLLVQLPAGEKQEIRLQTVCLDAGVPSPEAQEFEVSPAALPPVREKVLRWWADHPDAPQSAVNEAIWQFRETVRIGPGVVEQYSTPKGTFGALHGGTAFRLHDGELLSYDPDGTSRFLGTGIFQALPTADGLYAVGLGADGKPELWQFALTGEQPWGRVAAVPSGMRIKEVLPAGKDRLVLVSDGGVTVLDTRAGTLRPFLARSQVLDVSAVRAGEDGLSVILRVPGLPGVVQGGETKGKTQDVYEFWRMDLRRAAGTEECVKKYWNAESVVAGGAGVYGLTHAGRIRVLVGDDFKTLPDSEIYSRLMAVGPDVLWLLDPAGKIAAARPRTGAKVHGATFGLDEDTAFGIDIGTGDLALVRGKVFRRVRAKDGAVEEIGAAPAAAPSAGGR